MGVMNEYGGQCLMGFRGLRRRKQVDSENLNINHGHQQLAKRLNVLDLVGIGVGTTIGAGVYILIGTVAREQTGPALPIAFLIAGIAAALSAICYTELSCRCPSAGSAYHYSYICIGEGVAWIIGWGLTLEYAIGASVVARGVSPNLALYFGGEGNLPVFLARHTVFGIVVDPCAAALVIIATILLCTGIKESTLAQTIVTSINVCALLFVIVAGGYLAFKNGWVGYELSNGYLPFGINGVLGGSATVFFSYIGFDSVTATAEEVKNPKKDLPLGIGISLSLSCILYMILSFIIVGLVPYYDLDKDTPISSAFSVYGVEWAAFIVSTGAVMALLASLMGSLLPQSRILMAMARDGLLPSFFSVIDKRTQVPVKGTIAVGFLAAVIAFCMDVDELAGMVSVGTLLAFTSVALSVLVIRYIPPIEVHPLASAGESSSSSGGHGQNMQGADEAVVKDPFISLGDDCRGLILKRDPCHGASVDQETNLDNQKGQRRRPLAAWLLTIICIGVIVFTSSASAAFLPSSSRIILCGIGGAIFLAGTAGLVFIGQDDAAGVFGHTGGFICPFVPYLPAACMLLNTYLLINLGIGTWIRVSVWLLLGALLYLFYGRTHSLLLEASYVPITHTEDIYSP
ncbi:cationic amino acid transporter 4, vacuolar-like [Chenopodium quinoa]|uniref:cationic amino acid transporter 4, vacuolar-like n=1 Tax=Chenopodium quinoa TaxID=63459 RepID=UPI000B774872|nr:cationic amino acid transporter 4, vacuolar-like [Chenopodium quinoa]XP_021776050.1 cationic amino acid transporter 4, vacuolar-like [Chenopodium quinoa]